MSGTLSPRDAQRLRAITCAPDAVKDALPADSVFHHKTDRSRMRPFKQFDSCDRVEGLVLQNPGTRPVGHEEPTRSLHLCRVVEGASALVLLGRVPRRQHRDAFAVTERRLEFGFALTNGGGWQRPDGFRHTLGRRRDRHGRRWIVLAANSEGYENGDVQGFHGSLVAEGPRARAAKKREQAA